MTILLEGYLHFIKNAESKEYEIDPFDLLKDAIEKLKRHETKEKKGSILEDKTLIGYLNLIEKLIGIIGSIDPQKLGNVIE